MGEEAFEKYKPNVTAADIVKAAEEHQRTMSRIEAMTSQLKIAEKAFERYKANVIKE